MGWRPQPRYDKSRKSWHCRYRNKKHYLGTEYTEACKRFAKIVGDDGNRETPLTVAEAVAAWQPLHGSDWTWWILKTWVEHAGKIPLHRLGENHLTEYLAYLQTLDQSAATIRHKVRSAGRVCRWCVKSGYLEVVPDMPKTPKPVTRPRDVGHDQLIEAFAELPKQASPVLRFILETGCRPGEACGLRWDQIDFRRGVANLTEHKTARSGKPRTLFLSPAAVEILKSVPRKSVHVFLSRLHKPYTPNGLRSILRRRGISTVYSLRHTSAQSMLDQGVPMEDVAKLLGHRDLSIVQTYAQVRDDRARRVASSLISPLQPQPGDRSKRPTSRGVKDGRSTGKRTKRRSAKSHVA